MSPRFHGLIKVVGAGAALVLVTLVASTHSVGDAGQQGPLRLAAMAVPALFAMIGIAELTFGPQIHALINGEHKNANWQRGVGGALALILAIGLVGVGMDILG
ncbi:hypothetical protein [Nitrogeniibacter aestuarii]|uniref:hypothetical protein n=1 Tax=Nitrogeniibacter aestuarii TaxID=2815343 RepID=UPI001D121465|nr:hypothetical protein [Nitrogeniibacter aestuarii]